MFVEQSEFNFNCVVTKQSTCLLTRYDYSCKKALESVSPDSPGGIIWVDIGAAATAIAAAFLLNMPHTVL